MTRHPSEQTVGRIRRDGGWDQRFGSKRLSDPCPSCGQPNHHIRYQASPQRNQDGSQLVEVILSLLVLLAFGVGLWAWTWIADAAVVAR